MGGAARRTPVDGQASSEKIGATANRGGRDARRQAPGEAIRGSRQQEIIGPYGCIAEVFSPAIRPDDVHSARLVNFSRGKVRGTKVARITVI